jgi:predicted glutamine amidotransferase
MKLFAVTCNQPERLRLALAPVRGHLRAAGPVSRWGLAYDHGGEILLIRTPQPGQDIDLAAPLDGVASDYVIAQAVRDQRTPLPDNTPPFRFRRWMFAQLGGFDVAAVWSRAVARIPEFLRRTLRSKEPGDLSFHLFLAALHEVGSPSALDDPNLSPQVTRKALAVAARRLEGDLQQVGAAQQLGSVVVSNGRSMLALRRAGALRMRRLFVPNDRGERDERFRCVIFLSSDSLAPEDGFEELGAGQVAMVRRDLTLELATLDG